LKLILLQSALLWKKASDKDIESYYYVIAFLLKELSGSSIHEFLPIIVDSVKNETKDRVHLRLSLLKGLFNWFPDLDFKTTLYKIVLEYALETNQVYITQQEVNNIESIIEDWHLDPIKRREFYSIAIKMLLNVEDNEKRQAKLFHFINKYLTSIVDNNFDEHLEKIKNYVLYIIQNDVFYIGNISDIPAVKSLESSVPQIHNLLKIFITGEVREMEDFVKNNIDFLKKEGIDTDDVLVKFRISRFSDLASTKSEISYSEVASVLNIDIDEVENWVVQAISKNFVKCSLDQIDNKIIVWKAIPRSFSNQNWIELNHKLESWKNNFINLKNSILKNSTQS